MILHFSVQLSSRASGSTIGFVPVEAVAVSTTSSGSDRNGSMVSFVAGSSIENFVWQSAMLLVAG